MPKQLNQSMQFNLQFTADTSAAKAALQQLQTQLQKLSMTSLSGEKMGFTKELRQASSLVTELQTKLKASTSMDSGLLNLTKFNSSLLTSKRSLEDYRIALNRLGPQGAQAFSQLANSIMTAEIPIKRTTGLIAEMATTFKNSLKWFVASTAIHRLSGAIQTAYNYSQDLNKSLNNIRIVTGQNVEQMAKFAESANKAARALNVSTLDYSNAALIYYQQGLSDKEVEARTNVTAKMANVTRQSAEEVSSQLTAIWNNYAKGAENLEYYADVITALGAATASSSQEIATGLEKFAAVGETVGLSYEYATAALATVTATTRQSAEVVGNAFKTLFARLQGLKLGETQDDGTDLNKYSAALMQVGINIKDASGNLKDMDTILDETAAKWDLLTKAQQMGLAQTVAGVRQYTQFIALMENWDFMQENLAVAKNSSGTLQEQAETYAESWEAARKRVKTAAEAIYNDLIDEEFFIKFDDTLSKMLDSIRALIKGLGGLPGILTVVSTLMLKTFGPQMAANLSNMGTGLLNLLSNGQYSQSTMVGRKQEAVLGLKAQAAEAAKAGNLSGDVSSQIYAKQAEIQGKLIAQGEKLSDESRQRVAAENDIVNALSQQAIKEAQIADQKKRSLVASIPSTWNDAGKNAAREYINLHQNTNIASGIIHGIEDTYGNKMNKNITTDIRQDVLSNIDARQSAMSPEVFHHIRVAASNAQGTVQDLKKAITDTIAMLEQSAEIALFNSVDAEIDESNPKIKKYKQDIDELENKLKNGNLSPDEQTKVKRQIAGKKGAMTRETNGQVKQFTQDVKEAENATDGWGQAVENSGNAMAVAGQKAEGMGQVIDREIINSMPTFSQSFMTLATSISSVAMSFTMFKGLIDTWSNEDLNFGEKLLTTFTTLGMTLPMLISSFSNLNAAKLSGLAIDSAKNKEALKTIILGQAEKTANQENAAAMTEKDAADLANLVTSKGLLATIAVKIGLIKAEELQNKKLTEAIRERIIAEQMGFNLIAGGAAIIALIGLLAVLSASQKKLKELQEATNEAISKQAEKTTENANSIVEETNALNELIASLADANQAYKDGTGSKQELEKIGYQLVEQYGIENGALLLLQGNYDALIQKSRKYQAEKAKEQQNKIFSEDAYTTGSGHFIAGYGEIGQISGSSITAAKEAGIDIDKLFNYGYDENRSMTKLITEIKQSDNRNEFIQRYDDIKQAVLDLAKKDPINELIPLMNNYLDRNKEAYNEEKAILEAASTTEDIIVGNSVDLGEIDNDLAGTATAVEKMTNAVSEAANNPDSPYAGLEPDEQQKKAIELLREIYGWDSKKIVEWEVLTKYSNDQGIDFNTVAQFYEELPNETHKTIVLELISKGLKLGSDTWNSSFETELANRQLALHNTNVNGLTTARDKFKKGMSSAELDKWAQDSGVNWGQTGELGIDKNDFLAMSDTGREQWLYQRQYKERQAAYAEAQKIKTEKIITPDQQKIIDTYQQIMNDNHLSGLDNLEAYLTRGGKKLSEEYLQFKELLSIQNDLDSADSTFLEENARRANEFASSMETISSLNQEDKISTEELEQMKSAIDKSVGEYFVSDGHGKWQLVVDKITFQGQIEDDLSNKLVESGGKFSSEQQTQIVNYANSLTKLDTYTVKYNINSDISKKRLIALASQYPQLQKQVQKYNQVLNNSNATEEEKIKAERELRKELKKSEWDQVIIDIEKYIKTLNNSKATNKEIVEANQKIAQSFKEMFNIDVDSSWIAQHKDLLEELYNADAEYVNDVALKIETLMALEQAELNGVFDGLSIGYDQLKSIIEANPISVDAEGNADMTNLIQGLVDAGASAEAVAAILRAIGQTNVTLESIGTTFDLSTAEGMQEFANKFKTAIKASPGSTIPKTTGTGAHDLTEKIGGGSGGGGNKTETHKREEKRYEYETEVLSDLEKALDRISKAKDRAFGQNHINLINEEIESLEKEIDAQKVLLNEVDKFAKSDYNELLNGKENAFEITPKNGTAPVLQNAIGLNQLLEGTGLSLQLDDLGNIINIYDIRKTLQDYYNAGVDKFNTGKDEDAWNITKGHVEWLEKQLDQYTETINKQIDEEAKLQDILWEKQDRYAEKINKKIEYRIQLEKNEIVILDNALRAIENNFYRSAEFFTISGNKFKETIENAENLRQDYQKWLDYKGNISEEAFREGMQQVFDSAGENIEDLMSQWESLSEYYSSYLDKFDSRLKFETRLFDNWKDELEYYKDLLSVTGRQKDYDKIAKILNAEKEVIADRLAVNRSTQTLYQTEYDKIKEAYDNAIKTGNEAQTEFLRPSLEAAADKLDEINRQVRDDIKEIADLAQAEFTNAIDKIYDAAEKSLTDNLGFDYLSQIMDLASERADNYLTKTNQIYETTSLLRQINQDIDKTDNTAAKTRLKNFSQEIEALQAKGELSHYELEDAQARYEILKAQIALEEAQNAKSTVRLQRDSEGNFGYVYTADKTKIDKAQDNLLKAQNDRYNKALQTQQDYLRKFYDSERAAQEALRKLDEDYENGLITSVEDYNKRRKEIIDYYHNILQADEEIHTQALTVLNETSAQRINDSWTNTFGNEGQGLIGKANEWKDQTTNDTTLINAAFTELKDTLKDYVEPEYDNFETKVNNVVTESNNLNTSLSTFVKNSSSVIETIRSQTTEYSKMADELDRIVTDLKDLQGDSQTQIKQAGLATYTAVDKNGHTYTIHSKKGNDFIENSKLGDTITGGDGSSWTHNDDGSISIFKNGIEYKYNGSWDNNIDEDVEDTEDKEETSKLSDQLDKIIFVGQGNNRTWKDQDGNIIGTGVSEGVGKILQDTFNGLFNAAGGYSISGYSSIGGNSFTGFALEEMKKALKAAGYLSGGYTGSWTGGSDLFGGKLAMLHEKELVLNQEDTKNMLASVQIIRELAQAIDLRAAASNVSSGLNSPAFGFGSQILEQQVTIHAEFPNATNHNEIEEAFNNLVNRASQYANRQ